MAEPAEAIDDMREECQPRGPILIGRDDVLPGVAATGDMIDGVGKFKTQGAGHGAWCIGRPYVIARPDPCDPCFREEGNVEEGTVSTA